MRLLLASEGGRDIGRSGHDPERHAGAVRVLVARIVGHKLGRQLKPEEVVARKLPRLHHGNGQPSGYPRKVDLAIKGAMVDGYTAVVIVVDRDRTPGRERLKSLEKGVAMARAGNCPLADRTAVGVAIETAEAWLLADEVALNAVLGLDPKWTALPDPETLGGRPGAGDHPKVVFSKALAEGTCTPQEPYTSVAEAANLDTVTARCPNGFGELRKRVVSACL